MLSSAASGKPGGIFFTPTARTSGTHAEAYRPRPLRELAAEILAASSSPIQVLFLNDANPVFGTPPAWRVKKLLRRIPYIVSFGSFLDETSILADLILPDHSFLESWVDDVPEAGTQMSVASVAPPVMRPLHQTRSMPDVLLEIGQRLQRPLSLPWKNYEEMLQERPLPALPEKVTNRVGRRFRSRAAGGAKLRCTRRRRRGLPARNSTSISRSAVRRDGRGLSIPLPSLCFAGVP